MEKSNGVKCRKHFCFVILASFILSISLFYFNSSALIRTKKQTQLSTDDYLLGISPQPNLLLNASRQLPLVLDDGFNHISPLSALRESRIEYSDPYLEKMDEPVAEEDKAGINQYSSNLDSKAETIGRLTEKEGEAHKHDDHSDPCKDRYIYVHELPSKFNNDILKNCKTISLWIDMCHYLSNMGLGPRLGNSQGVFTSKGWFATDQFTLDLIFHNRLKQYKCLTKNSSMASAIFVPFYAGFDVSRYLWGFNTTVRDSSASELVKWLSSRPEWRAWDGRDHFLVAGRITWDFRRIEDKDSDWGSNLMMLPEAKNMSMLVIESSPWHSNDIAIPYPTYFHPSSDGQVFQWQNRMRQQKKRYLFSFAGAPRPNLIESIRDHIINQCLASRRKCKLLACNKGGDKCRNPSNVMKLFQNSIFCLQPSGDSYTRRSAFDSILAGCIPVFFHPGSAYVQYMWHLPQDYSKYSVLISEDDVRNGKVDIESRLRGISAKQVKAMREEVIRMIPRLIYADPRSRLETLEDAFDIAIKGVLERVKKVKRELREGQLFDAAENSWKYELFGTVEKHEWDHFFSLQKNLNSL